jgi:hypothetical protein
VLHEDALNDPGLARIALEQLASKIQFARSSASQALADAELRVSRAEEHVVDIRGRLDRWGKEQDHGVRQTREGLVRLRQSGPPLPRMVNLVLGEAVQNLRTALDYLVYGLSWLDSGVHHERTQFPIADLESSFESQRHRLAGLADNHVSAIQDLQPFAGCEWTAALRDASNQDKHWALQVAIGQGSVEATNIGQPDFEIDLDVRIVLEDDTDVFEWLEDLIENVRGTLGSFASDFNAPVVLHFRGLHLELNPTEVWSERPWAMPGRSSS